MRSWWLLSRYWADWIHLLSGWWIQNRWKVRLCWSSQCLHLPSWSWNPQSSRMADAQWGFVGFHSAVNERYKSRRRLSSDHKKHDFVSYLSDRPEPVNRVSWDLPRYSCDQCLSNDWVRRMASRTRRNYPEIWREAVHLAVASRPS